MTDFARMRLAWIRAVAALLFLSIGGVVHAQRPVLPNLANLAVEERRILVLLRQPAVHFRSGSGYGGGYGDALTRASRERTGRRMARRLALTYEGNWPMPLLGLDCLILVVPAGTSIDSAIAKIETDPAVDWAEPMHEYRTLARETAYDDPLYRAQPAAGLWHLSDLHKVATGRGSVVAVVDTQVDYRHPDLAGQISASRDFTGVEGAGAGAGAEQHGTGVAGIISAKANNGIGIVGVAPGARIMALRACWQSADKAGSSCNSLTLAKALHYALENGAQIVNMSLSGPSDRLLARLVDLAIARGLAVVVAYDPRLPRGGFPASHAGVFSVSDGTLARSPPGVYSAPGQDLPTTRPGGHWYLVHGSSYSAAHVSGLLALLGERRRSTGRKAWPVVAAFKGGAIDAPGTLVATFGRCDGQCARLATLKPGR